VAAIFSNSVHNTTHISATCTTAIAAANTNNSILIACVHWLSNSLNSVTYDGINMTQIGSSINTGTKNLALFYYLNPSKNVVATASASTSSWAVDLFVYTGVNQSSPIGTPASVANASIATFGAVLSNAGDDMYFESVSGHADAAPNSSQTVLMNNAVEMVAIESSKYPSAASEAEGWVQTIDYCLWIGVPIHPAYGGGQGASLSPMYMM
jgi:hypothetical protein